jgi:hypothetical protein
MLVEATAAVLPVVVVPVTSVVAVAVAAVVVAVAVTAVVVAVAVAAVVASVAAAVVVASVAAAVVASVTVAAVVVAVAVAAVVAAVGYLPSRLLPPPSVAALPPLPNARLPSDRFGTLSTRHVPQACLVISCLLRS